MSTRLDSSQSILRYIKEKYWDLIKDDVDGYIQVTAFRPSSHRTACDLQIACKLKQGPFPYWLENIEFSLEEISLVPEVLFKELLTSKVDRAMNHLIESICDPFDLDVRRIRLEAGKSDDRCSTSSD
jgi:hypothetical protein